MSLIKTIIQDAIVKMDTKSPNYIRYPLGDGTKRYVRVDLNNPSDERIFEDKTGELPEEVRGTEGAFLDEIQEVRPRSKWRPGERNYTILMFILWCIPILGWIPAIIMEILPDDE